MRSRSLFAGSQNAQTAKSQKIEQGAGDLNVLATEVFIPIKDLKAGIYNQIFLVDQVHHTDAMVTNAGSPFARITLKDITGTIEGVVWNYVPIEEGQFYIIKLEAKTYKGDLEFQTESSNITETQPPLNINDYIKGVSESELMAHAAVVENAFESITDSDYQNIIGNAIHRFDLISNLKMSPYGLSGPLAYRGGLLVHVAGSLKLAKVIADQAAGMPLNMSLVTASCMLRNIGWHTTTCFNGQYIRSKDAYYMTGINAASLRYINHMIISIESDLLCKFPESKKLALENACNDVANIRTIEGRIAASADSMIDLLHFGSEALQRKSKGNWTEEFFIGHNK